MASLRRSPVSPNPGVGREIASDQDLLNEMEKPRHGLFTRRLGTDQVGKHQAGMQGLEGDTAVPSRG